MLLSIITVAFRNLAGIVKTHASLPHLAQADVISFEWIVVDGGSNDGTREYLGNLNGIYNLRFVSEPDNGIYDAMNKGIEMAQGKFALFLNSGDIFHQDAANFVRKLKVQKDNMMITGDALLDFGDGHKIKRSAKPGWYIYHSLPASHQAMFFPVSGLKKWRYDLEYKVSSDYALAAKMYKAGYAFKKLNGLVSEFSMGGVSTTNNMELCADAKKVQRQILHVPGFWAELSWHLREPDNGIYDAMNKGIEMAQGKFALFLNSGDIFHQDAANFVRKLKVQKDNMMITGDALLDFGDGHKIKRSAKPGWYIYHSLPASHQAMFFPVSGLKKWRYDLEYKVSSDYALAAKMYKAGYAFKKLNGLVSEFSMGGVSTTNNMELCADAKKVQRQILHVPGFWAELSWHLRQRTTSKTKALYNKS